MNPTSYAHFNHNEKGMILTRIRGGIVKPWGYGGKSMCHHPVWLLILPCLIQPPPLKVLLLVGAVMAGNGVWQDCQSFPTRTLHQQIEPHIGRGMTTMHSRYCLSIHAHKRSHSSSRRDHCLFIILTHRIFSCFWLTQRAGSRALSSTIFLWRAIHVFGCMISLQTGMAV